MTEFIAVLQTEKQLGEVHIEFHNNRMMHRCSLRYNHVLSTKCPYGRFGSSLARSDKDE